MESLLSKAAKLSEQSELFSISSRHTFVHFQANHLRQVYHKEASSVALRIIKEGRIGVAVASGIADAETLLDMATETSRSGLPANFSFPAEKHYPRVNTFDPGAAEITVDRMVPLGNELIAKITQHTPNILCDVTIVNGVSSIHLINSQGGEASYDKSSFSLGVEGILVRDTDMLFVGDERSSCDLPSSAAPLADKVVEQLELAKSRATISTKPMPVILAPHAIAAALIPAIEVGFNGKTVFEGTSPLKGRIGEQVFDSKLNLWDDATIAYSLGSRPCDDEGMPSQRLPLVKDGVVLNFIYDLQAAALANTMSTANAERSGSGFPRPAISSLIVDKGDVSFKDMLSSMKEGLVVEELIGAGQGDILSGDFSGNILLGYKVENGEIVGRVKDSMISGNVYQVLQDVSLGSEARWVNGRVLCPHLYFPHISVAVTGK